MNMHDRLNALIGKEVTILYKYTNRHNGEIISVDKDEVVVTSGEEKNKGFIRIDQIISVFTF